MCIVFDLFDERISYSHKYHDNISKMGACKTFYIFGGFSHFSGPPRATSHLQHYPLYLWSDTKPVRFAIVNPHSMPNHSSRPLLTACSDCENRPHTADQPPHQRVLQSAALAEINDMIFDHDNHRLSKEEPERSIILKRPMDQH